jgi:hypothetical protein
MSKMKKISTSALIITLVTHFFCCILPTFLMLFNFIFGTSLIFEFELFSHNVADIILYISGIFVFVSFIMQFFHKTDKKDKIMCYITTIMYILMLIFDIFSKH